MPTPQLSPMCARSLRLPALAAALACAFAAGCEAPPAPEDGDITFPDEPFATLTSDDGAAVLEVRTAPSQPPARGRTHVELRLTDQDGEALEGATLTVVPFMPDMAHAAANEPDVEPLGGGMYEVTPVDMIMSGRWELLTTIDGPVHDRANITFEIE